MSDKEELSEQPKQERIKTEEGKVPMKEPQQQQQQQQQQDWLSVGALWGSSWLKSAKEKTFTTFELVKKDLSEFGDVVASEATAIANTTVESVKHQAHTLQQMVSPEDENNTLPGEEQMPKSDQRDKTPTPEANVEDGNATTFTFGWTPKLPQMSAISNSGWVKSLVETVKSIAQEDTTSDEDQYTEAILPNSLSEHNKSTRKSDLPHCAVYAIQTDKQTYVTEPDGDEHLFSLWQEEFNLLDYDQQINNLLKNCPPMRALYQELVPSTVDNLTFWKRYFYKIYQAELMNRCKKETLKQELYVGTESSINNQSSHSDKQKLESKRSVQETGEKLSPDGHSNNDETWSMCSSTNIEIQEIHDDGEGGPQTPRATESPDAAAEKNEKSSDGWVNWEE